MTPKEKAEILVAKFIKHSRAEKDIKPIQSAKQCALIAVDEIINIWEYSDTQEKWWWQQVRKEIEKL
jgi:hypothetical protein